MRFTMSNFNQNKYIQEYMKERYKNCKILLKPEDNRILTEYCEITGENKATLFKLCLKYCYDNMISIDELKRK